MSVLAQVKFQIELTDEEYDLILALRAMDEVRREAWINYLERLTTTPIIGLSGKEVAHRLTKWRDDLTPPELEAMDAALAELDADELPKSQFPSGTPVSEFLESMEKLRADMTPDEIESFRRIVENDLTQVNQE